jgi:hypothetical protein
VNRDLADWQSKVLPRLHNETVALICEVVWPGTSSLPAPLQAFRYGAVRDVIDGFPTPVLSMKDRDAIHAAAKPILEGAK